MIDFSSADWFDKLVVLCGGGLLVFGLLWYTWPRGAAQEVKQQPKKQKRIKDIYTQLQERESRTAVKEARKKDNLRRAFGKIGEK